MVNQYGQTDLTQALLAQGTSRSPYKTGLGQAARLGGVALAEWGKRKKADESRSALAEALAGLNRGTLTGEGPTTDAAGRAPIRDPQLMARLLSDQNTAQVGQSLLARALQPAPERKIIKGADGYNYYMNGERVLPNAQKPVEGFTLGAGQRRFEGGEMVAEGAPRTLSPRDLAFARLSPDEQRQVLMKPNATVQMGKGETEFEKATGKDLAAARTAIVDSGQSAVGTEQTFQQLGDLMQDGVNTGSLQPLVASLQGIAEDLGVDLQGEAQALGIELGDLGNQQNFDRLATQVVINGFEQFKGNLNQKEVSLALGAFGGLGTSPEANADAIAAGIAASQIARERAVLASRAKTQQQVRTIQESILSGDVTDFRQRKEQIKQGILARRASGGMPTIQGDADYEALPSGTRFRAPDGSVRVKP
ncbi:MAG: hypothetical protein DHS20C03_08600 [Minwuia thermotolerans]|nr:MAG: hypothetical protein DHS20C03_08600 [Minwuia thermotolerans]